MTASRFLRVGLATLVALLALAPATVVLAVPPAQTTVYVDDAFEDPALTTKCGFPVQIHLQGKVKMITRFNQESQPVREFLAFPNFRVTFSAFGNSFTTPGPAVEIRTLAADGSVEVDTVAGLIAAIHIPGEGVILLDAGKITFRGQLGGEIIAEAGPHELFGTGDATAMCNALAGT